MKILKCPIEECKFHRKIITGTLSLLTNHIFRDHDYVEKLEASAKLGVIESMQERRSAQWLSEQLAKLGIIGDDKNAR